ncbi:MAG: EutN/CcmL family microcompartment protein [Planctomycetaceae bacterium]|nr:EutN/CcmL family microcompartment protein [Planctomycetaceae bacterium]MCB9949549.1 EutN/CcmL family microcompartment protein [Planctomycetaceae bacterium]
MFIARVTGNLTATQKVSEMNGQKLFIVEPMRVDEAGGQQLKGTGRTFIAVDAVGAGEGETVLIVQGSSARFTKDTKPLPIDCAIIGIVDNVRVGGADIFKSSSSGGG